MTPREDQDDAEPGPDAWIHTKALSEPLAGSEAPDHLEDWEAKVWNAAVRILMGNGNGCPCGNDEYQMRECRRCHE